MKHFFATTLTFLAMSLCFAGQGIAGCDKEVVDANLQDRRSPDRDGNSSPDRGS